MDFETEYSPSSAIGGNYQPFLQAYQDLSQAAFAQVPCVKDLRYGQQARALIDYFPAPKQLNHRAAGLLVFIHGGYWQELSKNESAFVAPAWHAAGFAHAVLGYTLAPHAKLGEIVAQCRAAVRFLRDRSADLGHDADRIVVAGSSAGGYLAAACAADDSLNLAGIVPISGIFDVQPLVGTSINAALGMTVQEAAKLSALTQAATRVPAVVAWAEIETQAFKQQSQAFATLLRSYGQHCKTLEIPQRNHFDVVHELGKAHSPLFLAARELFDHSA
jgi:arylformamidase